MKTNRRQLLQGATAAGAGLALGVAPSVYSAAFAAGEIEELRIATAQLPPQLDPQTTSWIVMLRVYSMIFDSLIARDWSQGGKLVPSLAASWTQLDELTLDVELRQDVFFHDGTKMTSTDVKYTFDRSLQGDPNLVVTGLYKLKEVIATDEYHVRFVTTEPNGPFLMQLSTRDASIVPAAYHQQIGYEGFQSAPIGTGPFKLTEFIPDTHLKFVRHDQYFGGPAAAKSVTLTGVPEVSTRIAALLNGEVDLILDVPPDQASTIENAGGDFTLNSASPLNVNVFDIVGGNAPMTNKQLRQAMSLAIDRKTIIDELLMGNGLHPSGIQSIFDPLYVERAPLAFDPERAKQLVTESGYAGEEIQMVFDTPDYYPSEQAWAEAVAAMWTDIGLNVKMVGLDVGQRVDVSVPDSPYHVITDSAGVLADIDLVDAFGRQTGYYANMHPVGAMDDVIALVSEASKRVDQAERLELYTEALALIDDFVPMIVLFTINRVAAMRKEITFSGRPDFGIDLRAGNFSVA
jgi:peptide/nickel transport system substrate-binding protein